MNINAPVDVIRPFLGENRAAHRFIQQRRQNAAVRDAGIALVLIAQRDTRDTAMIARR